MCWRNCDRRAMACLWDSWADDAFVRARIHGRSPLQTQLEYGCLQRKRIEAETRMSALEGKADIAK